MMVMMKRHKVKGLEVSLPVRHLIQDYICHTLIDTYLHYHSRVTVRQCRHRILYETYYITILHDYILLCTLSFVQFAKIN